MNPWLILIVDTIPAISPIVARGLSPPLPRASSVNPLEKLLRGELVIGLGSTLQT